MSNVYKLQRARLPNDATRCLERLAEHAKTGSITGIAFVCIMEGDNFIADTCGTARAEPFKTRELLKALDARIAKRQMRER